MRLKKDAKYAPNSALHKQEQETLYVLQNKSLMEQIERSLKTHREGSGYQLSPADLNALDCV